jgi:N-acetylglutamate synthase-like GNAT family acetyltransferase
MITIKSPVTPKDFREYYALRHGILHHGQPRGIEKDDYEPISQHIMAVDEDTQKIVGEVKLHEKESGVGQFSYLAVLPQYRAQGVGKQLMDRIEELARQAGFRVIGCYTQLDESSYFTRFGYQVTELPAFPMGMKQVVWMEKALQAETQ